MVTTCSQQQMTTLWRIGINTKRLFLTLEDVWDITDKVRLISTQIFISSIKKTYIWETCQSSGRRSVHLKERASSHSQNYQVSLKANKWPMSKINYDRRVSINPECRLKHHKILVSSLEERSRESCIESLAFYHKKITGNRLMGEMRPTYTQKMAFFIKKKCQVLIRYGNEFMFLLFSF